MSDWTGSGYEAPASESSGLYCRLKSKGEQARLRLVSEPFRYEDELIQSDNARKILRKVGWVAILKQVVDGKPTKRIVVFQAGPMVYGAIKELAENPEWGDPKLYDITVTRTEEKGKYYTVIPHPKPIGPISKEEEALVAEANIDLKARCLREGSKEHREPGIPADESGYDPFGDE